jgi:two-component system, OmpR family, phosphate regulon sensor histidine kinase PhoR
MQLQTVRDYNESTANMIKLRLFWKIGILHLLLLLMVLLALDVYVVQALRKEYLNSAFAQLESISKLVLEKPPSAQDDRALKNWGAWISKGGMRVTLITAEGKVLADSEEDRQHMENHLSRPEIKEALATGSGRAVRYSTTLRHDLVYLAQRYDASGGQPMIMRFSLPLRRLDEALSSFRGRLWIISTVILILSGCISLLFFRNVTNRIQRLKEFSHRVAEGDFRPLAVDLSNDELADLSGSLNQTALELDRTIRSLTQERNQSAAILASMEEGVAVIGRDQRIIYCNNAFCRAVGVSNIAWSGRPLIELIRHSDLIAFIQKALTGNEVVQGEIVVGSIRTRSFAVTSAPVRTEGAITGAVMVLHDISEIRRLERARRDFVANVSHEFKTPLTAIQGFAETLLGGAIEDKDNRRHFLEIIRDHALRLGSLTDDLLKLAQIEAGQLPKEERFVDIKEIVEPCMETIRTKAEQKNLVLEVNYGPDLPKVFGDPHSYQEILQNLLTNAVRYSSQGGRIKVEAVVRDSEIVLSVTDTGIGIPKSDQDRIFERFYRTDAARSRESGGTGLGLSIAKHLVEARGGRIKVESEVGRGSTFHVFLPLGS